MAEGELARRLADTDAAVIMKVGRNLPKIRRALQRPASCSRPSMSSAAPWTNAASMRLADKPDDDGALFRAGAGARLGGSGRERPARRDRARARQRRAGDAGGARGRADGRRDFFGYGPYLDRLTLRAGQIRHASDNREELSRAAAALARAAEGVDVAVVSGGDPGVFAMAAAVCEAIEAGPAAWRDIELTVVPGVTAMLAVAARIGAPLGHDFCAISLSDNLKPWELIERRLDAASKAGFVIALYNPISKARPWQLGRAFELPARQSAGRDAGDLRAGRRPARRAHREHAARRGRSGRRRHGDLRHHRLGRDAGHRARQTSRRWSTRRAFPRTAADERPAATPPRRFRRSRRRCGGGRRTSTTSMPSVARRRDLGIGRVAAAVLGEHGVDPVFEEQRALGGDGERAAVEDVARVGNGERRIDRIDAAHQIGMVRRGTERRQFLAAERDEHAARLLAELADRVRDRSGDRSSDRLRPAARRDGRARRTAPWFRRRPAPRAATSAPRMGWVASISRSICRSLR